MSIEQNDYICSMHGRAEPKGDLRFEPTVQLSLLCSHSFFLCIGSPFWSHHPLSFSFFSGETAVFAERSMSKLLLCGGTTSDCNLCGWMAPLPAMCRCHQLTQTTYTYFFGIMSSRMRGDIPPQNEFFFSNRLLRQLQVLGLAASCMPWSPLLRTCSMPDRERCQTWYNNS